LRALKPIVAAAGLLLALAAPAQASRGQESIFQDDGLLQQSGPDTQSHALDEMQALGADTIHVLVGWRRIAPEPESSARPAFDASDPAAYPAGAFDGLDRLVKEARKRRLDLLFTPTSGIPNWASRCSATEARRAHVYTCDPDPAEFEAFVQALGRHFSGDLAVNRWSFFNEPNFKGWLRPQFKRVRGRTIANGAIMYRALLRAGIAGLGASGHGGDSVYAGETAPIGQQRGGPSTKNMAPGLFVRRLLCLGDDLRPLRGADASAYGCGSFSPLGIRGFAHHPYTKGGSQPPTSRVRNSDEITLAYIGRLERILSAAGRYGRIRRSTPIYSTEYGIQTDPPDQFFGVSPDKQAEYVNEADYMSWMDRRIRSVAQYNLVDDADVGGFNTGLIYNPNTMDGARKPSYDAYRTPIVVVKRGASQVQVWGQARPAGPNRKVEIQAGGPDGFQTVQTVTTGEQGYLIVTLPAQEGLWRLMWTDGAGATYTSREAKPVREPKFRH
jgi:hypothetical protein